LKNIPKLKAILLYHIIEGKFTVDEIGQMPSLKTFKGQEVKIDAAQLLDKNSIPNPPNHNPTKTLRHD
jgi:hypothetical protein